MRKKVGARNGIRRWILDLFLKQAQIALRLVAAGADLARIAMVKQNRLADAGFQTPSECPSNQSSYDLLVNSPLVKCAWNVAEKTRQANGAFLFASFVHQRHFIGDHRWIIDLLHQPLACARCQFFIRVKSQNPIAFRMNHCGVAGGAKIVVPNMDVDFRSVFPRDLDGAICGAGINHHDLTRDLAHRLKTLSKECLFVLDNHANGNAQWARVNQLFSSWPFEALLIGDCRQHNNVRLRESWRRPERPVNTESGSIEIVSGQRDFSRQQHGFRVEWANPYGLKAFDPGGLKVTPIHAITRRGKVSQCGWIRFVQNRVHLTAEMSSMRWIGRRARSMIDGLSSTRGERAAMHS